MSSYGSAEQIRREVAELIRPPRRVRVSDAVADTMIVVDGGGKAAPWDASLTPYITEAMDCLSSRLYDAVVFIGPARTGKTIGLIDGWISYVISCDPGDMLVVQITEEKAREYSKKRVDRMIRHSPKLQRLLSPRGFDNNVHDKTFRAGNYLGIKHPSINVMSSSDYRFVALTDYDRLPESIGGEGDAYTLASKRTQTFMSSGMTLVETSPGWDVTDPDWQPDPNQPHMAPPTKGALTLYNQGDRRKLYWQCPACSNWFQPILENFNLESAQPFCPGCGYLIDPSEKKDLNESHRWIPEGMRIDESGALVGNRRDSRIASFWMEGPAAAFQVWSSLAKRLQDAEEAYELNQSQETLKARINTDWGRPYQYRKSENKRSADAIKDRVEKALGERVVPEGVRCLFASVDVQGGKHRRFVVQVMGYGEHGERWLIDRFSLRRSERMNDDDKPHSVDPGAHLEDWDLLIENVISRSYPLMDNSGREMPVLLTGIDTGGEPGVTDNAYKFYRRLKRQGLHRKVMLIKGASTVAAPRIRESWPDNTGRKDRHSDSKGDIPLYLLNTNILKDAVAASLEREEEGAGYIHFPEWLGPWFFAELTYEQRDARGKWSKPGKGANEAFDLVCYSDAAAIQHGYEKINWDAPPPWARDWDSNSEIQQDGIRAAARNTADKPAERPRRRTRFRFS